MLDAEHTCQGLRQVALFQGVPGDDLRRIAHRMREHAFAAGKVVFREGEPGDRLFLVLTGQMHVYVERAGATITYARLHAGECFGEMALLDEAPRSATVQADAPSRCLTLAKEDFLALLASHPQIALGIVQSLSQRLRQASAQVQAYAQQLAQGHQTPSRPSVGRVDSASCTPRRHEDAR